MKILAIDPGERVGWARGRIEDGKLIPEERGVSHLKDFALALGKKIGNYDVVVYETWRLYPAMGKKMVGNDMLPSQLVGMIRYLAWIHPHVELVGQGAQIKTIAMKTMPDNLKKWIENSTEQHDQDAVMHLHYYWFKHYA